MYRLINAMKASNLVRRVHQKLFGDSASTESSPLNEAPVLRWNLDYPSSAHGNKREAGGMVVQGWILFSAPLPERPELVVRWHNGFDVSHTLTRERPDVIQAYLKASPVKHPQLRCGFRFTTPSDLKNFQLLLRIGTQEWLLKEVASAPLSSDTPQQLKVLEGRDGWLFLDNDTNNSVDQYCGRLLLSADGLTQWQHYLAGLAEIADTAGIPARLLIAPTKEAVLGRKYHPCEAGSITPVDQVLGLPGANLIIHPAGELMALGDEAFYRTDTHWTQQGAALATALLGKSLGLKDRRIDKLLAKDRYRERAHQGDLGSKLQPPRSATASFLKSFNYRTWVVYDNGLPNFGRMVVIRYPQALDDATCLIFGSSSSYSMLNYVCRFFQRVIFVHTAGNLDRTLISKVAPDYLVAQTNARFVVRPPDTDYSLLQTIRDKQAALDASALEKQARLRVELDRAFVESLGLIDWL